MSERMQMSHAHQVLLAFLAIEIIGAAIRETTTGLMPLKMRMTIALSWKLLNINAMARMIRNEGSTEPNVAAMLPLTPLIL